MNIHPIRRNRRLAAFLAQERGSLTVEYVIILPMFLIALAFSFEFGQVFIAHQSTEHNVRSAVRYLSRAELSEANLLVARNIAMTGQPGGGALPAGMTCAAPPSKACIDDSYDTFSDAQYSRSGKTVRIRVRVDYPLTLFGVFGDVGTPTIPFVITEDARYVGV